MCQADRGLREAPAVRRLVPALTQPLLLLWDIDGTLLQRASKEHARALIAAIEDVHGVSLEGLKVDAAGRTDRAIARSLLEAAGIGGDRVDEHEERVRLAACTAYEELCPPDLSALVAPGVAETLVALSARPDEFRFSLVTGNFEPVARRKLAAAGIGDYFPAGQGGFGSDAEARAELPPVARRRAGPPDWPRERTVVIGDTPRDIACARADGLRVVGIATGPHPAADLAGADVVVERAGELLPVLEALAASS